MISPATVRNEMAQLEKTGYILKPHTSAGSIPTDMGYRHYVESLQNTKLPTDECLMISHLFHQVKSELSEWLSLAALLAAQLVHNVAIVTEPKSADCRLKHVELVTIEGSRILLVLVLFGAIIKRELIVFNNVITQPKLIAYANKFTSEYTGLTSSQILTKQMKLSYMEKQVVETIIKIMQAQDKRGYEESYLNGWHFMMNQPEFSNNQQIINLISLAEQRNLLQAILPSNISDHEVHVIIGTENKDEAMKNYSVVIKQYGLPNKATGAIGIVGPTRMPYGRTISTINYLSSVLIKLVNNLYGKEATESLSNDPANQRGK
jgi:heat-inducible transcriptional repressor